MFDALKRLPTDPILGLIAKFQNDPNPNKIDLGVGVYKDSSGQTPVLQAVKRAEQQLLAEEQSKAYLGPLGNQNFNNNLAELALGDTHPLLHDRRLAILQTPGGCGALRVGAELAMRAQPAARVWVSDPTWANHIPLLGDAGLEIATYPYYQCPGNAINFPAMLDKLHNEARCGDLLLLHAFCHNPSGADLEPEHWDELTELVLLKGMLPFVDMAYQGLGLGLEEDAAGLRLMAGRVPEMLLAISCSKNFGLYRERVGAIAAITVTPAAAETAVTNLMQIARGIYSMPPAHGAAVVECILSNPALTALWQTELTAMRDRLLWVRTRIGERLAALGLADRFDFIDRQHGMFSFLGIGPTQVTRLADHYSIYMTDDSRMSISGLNENNIDYFCGALKSVVD